MYNMAASMRSMNRKPFKNGDEVEYWRILNLLFFCHCTAQR